MGIKKVKSELLPRGYAVFLSLNACMQSNATQGLSIIGMPRTILPHHQPLILFALHLFCWCCSSSQLGEILFKAQYLNYSILRFLFFRRMPSSHAVVKYRRQMPSSNAVVACRRHLPSSHAVAACRRRMPSSHVFVPKPSSQNRRRMPLSHAVDACNLHMASLQTVVACRRRMSCDSF